MFVSLAWCALASALAAPSATPSPLVNVPSVSADSTFSSANPTPVTADILTHYLGVKKGLVTYWGAHKDQQQAAAQSGHQDAIAFSFGQTANTVTFDYPALVKQNTELAKIFTDNQFKPEQFENVQCSLLQAVVEGAYHDAAATPVDTSTVLGKNITLVKAHSADLAAVGIKPPKFQSQGSGGGNDLQP